MIPDQFETLQEIFALIVAGIHEPYEKLTYECDVFDSYTDEMLTLIIDGKERTNVDTTYNGALLYSLIKKLHKQSLQQGDDWKSLMISHIPGEQVKTKYIYQHSGNNLF